MSLELDVLLSIRQHRAGRDQDLVAHDIDSGDALRHRMLDLNASIHFHEIKLVVLVHQEFERADIAVSDVFDRLDDEIPHLLPKLWRHDH